MVTLPERERIHDCSDRIRTRNPAFSRYHSGVKSGFRKKLRTLSHARRPNHSGSLTSITLPFRTATEEASAAGGSGIEPHWHAMRLAGRSCAVETIPTKHAVLAALKRLRWPNGFELTGAGLAPRCNDDRREAGRPVQRGVRRRAHLLAASCLAETIRLAVLALNRFGDASPQGRALVRGTLVGAAR